RHSEAGQPDPLRRRTGRRGDQWHSLAQSRGRHRHGLRPHGPGGAGNGDQDGRPGQAASGRDSRAAALLQGRIGFRTMADESYPDALRYHPEHDWARIEGDTATFGLTWYAQDALGEVVFYEPPEVGKEVKKDEAYAEVES